MTKRRHQNIKDEVDQTRDVGLTTRRKARITKTMHQK
jgi:hypothetical protein